VPIGDVTDRRLQRRHIQFADHSQDQREVVRRPGAGLFQPVEEPHPLLPVRQRHHLWTLDRPQRRPATADAPGDQAGDLRR
jgi:hypothetical protein